jgi:hypothetical protein
LQLLHKPVLLLPLALLLPKLPLSLSPHLPPISGRSPKKGGAPSLWLSPLLLPAPPTSLPETSPEPLLSPLLSIDPSR